jgi:hypothetical protein
MGKDFSAKEIASNSIIIFGLYLTLAEVGIANKIPEIYTLLTGFDGYIFWVGVIIVLIGVEYSYDFKHLRELVGG